MCCDVDGTCETKHGWWNARALVAELIVTERIRGRINRILVLALGSVDRLIHTMESGEAYFGF